MDTQHTLKDYKQIVQETNFVTEGLSDLSIAHDRLSLLRKSIENIAHQWKQSSNMSATVSDFELKKMMDSLSDDEFEEAIHNIVHNIENLLQTLDDFQHFFKENSFKPIGCYSGN